LSKPVEKEKPKDPYEAMAKILKEQKPEKKA